MAKVALVETKPSRTDFRTEFDGAFEFDQYQLCSDPGIKKVLIPIDNKKDLAEVPDSIKKNMEIIAVKNVDDVLKIALTKNLKRVEWVEVEQISKNKTEKSLKAPIN